MFLAVAAQEDKKNTFRVK